MGLWHILFGARPPSDPPENRETLRLLSEVRRLGEAARAGLPDREAIRYEARDAALRQGFPDSSPLLELLSDLGEALLDAATVATLPNELTVQTALKDVLAGVELRERLRDTTNYLKDADRLHGLIVEVLRDILFEAAATLQAPADDSGGAALFRVPLLTYLDDPAESLSTTIGRLYCDDVRATPIFRNLRDRLTENIEAASREHRTKTVGELAKKYPTPHEFIGAIARETPFLAFYSATFPFTIPRASRFEHLHIVAGSGHGKTQCLQLLILEDLARAAREPFGLALLDSQGDFITKLTRLNVFNPEGGALQDRLLLIDPNDFTHPVALNLFDSNLERFKDFEAAEREKIFYGVLELYRYIFSSLLGAELTQKQGVVFTNLARAMLAIPRPTLLTFYDFVEDGRAFRDVITELDPIPKRFFETQFFTSVYSETRKQIITRLLGILSNPVFEKMFGAEQNKVDMFGAMQDGKIIVINTAKDLLKSEGSAMFGRFFIALIAQATLARASLSPQERTPFHLYLDEAQEYLDQKTAELFNQGRKYHVGVAVAHQNLDQLTPEMRATLHASTAVKLVGGANYKDAASFAREMNTTPEFIQAQKKRAHRTEFACFVRHHTPRAVSITVPFGLMEKTPPMPAPAYMALLEGNRARVSETPKIAAPRQDEKETVQGKSAEPAAKPADQEPHTVATTPQKSSRPPKDDLDFYID